MVCSNFVKNRLFNKRKKGVYLFLFFLLLGISIISSGVLSDNLTGNSIKNFAEYKGGEQFDKGKGEISTFEKKEIKSTSVEGFENGKEKREDFVSDNFILSSYGTPLELVGKGTTPNEQELLYKFNSTDKPYSYVAIESEGIKKLEFFKKQNTAPKTKNEKTISNEEPLDFSKEAEIKNFTKFWNSSESDKIKNKLENSNINSLNSEVIPKENVSLYKIKHKQKSQVYVRVKTSSDLKFLVLDPAGSSAVFDSGFSAPYCSNYLSPCIANSSLLISRDNIDVNEPNSPNTIDSAPDGTSGSYQSDESVENITITNLNHSSFGGGDTVEVSTWVYCWGDSDDINFGYSPNASSPAWQQAYHTTCAGTGFF
ncbi:MAG TPA: hypothetical protein VJ912_01975, partial [Candidatus Nanoarchaeia archaeon]|nr:hypothetical protein [Candidatus Nanoarchaeia archaeon]